MAEKDKKQLEQEKRAQYDEFFRKAVDESWPHASCATDRLIFEANKKIILEVAKKYHYVQQPNLCKHQLSYVNFVMQNKDGIVCYTNKYGSFV